VVPLTIKGIAWYQGESNGDNLADAIAYRVMFPALINDWRARWGWEAPFLFVQLANFQAVQTNPVERRDAWPYDRESQALALALPSTGMSLTIDLNDDPAEIHPKAKAVTGLRLAQVALAKVYGKATPYTGPLYKGMKAEGGKIRVSFDNVSGGFKVRPRFDAAADAAVDPGSGPKGFAIKGFAIAGADGKFAWGDARIDGSDIIVSSPQVAAPVAVRYDWANNPIGNLYDGADLPAAPFRTDTETVPGTASIPLLGKTVTLRALDNGKYVTDEPQGNGPLVNNGDGVGRAEKFTVIDRGYGVVTLQAQGNGKYTFAFPKGTAPLKNSSATLGGYESFELVPVEGGGWALGASGKYVTADPQGIKPLVNDADDAGPQQAFEITAVP
jgi:hypothetical protein